MTSQVEWPLAIPSNFFFLYRYIGLQPKTNTYKHLDGTINIIYGWRKNKFTVAVSRSSRENMDIMGLFVLYKKLRGLGGSP